MLRDVERYFNVYNIEELKDGYRFYVIPLAEDREIKRFLAMLSESYDVSIKYHYGEIILEIRRSVKKERIWINVLLFLATFATTTAVGSTFYGTEINLIGGLLFSSAIMFVLGSHEMGHYFAAKRWGMKTTLPYFIPFPTIIGTLGAVIKHKGPIPNRKALFDVGVSGPVTGIIASIVVVLIGLQLPYEISGEPTLYINTPPIFDILISVTGFEGFAVHPVAFAGWVGFFITFMNMIPAGQLDGGHVLRAIMGKRYEVVSRTIPVILVAFGFLISEIYKLPGQIWVFWGVITFFFSMQGHPEPIDDDLPLDFKRLIAGIGAFILAFLCFTPVPFYYP
jgi:membrane-associated protease RseP (regulator of RpoE activity)